MQKLVGSVTLRLANVEAMIDGIIRFQYVPDGEKGSDLLVDVLTDEGFSFGLRCNVLRKVLVRNGRTEKQADADVQPLRRLGNTRNVFAHLGKGGMSADKAGYLDAKKPGQVLDSDDIEAKFRQFEVECAAAEAFLIGWLTKLSPYQWSLRDNDRPPPNA